jgi:tight adherence protein C
VIYVVAGSVALTAGLLVLLIFDALPARSQAVRGRMSDLGLDALLTGDAAARRARRQTWSRDILKYLGEWMRPQRHRWSRIRTRLIHGGYRGEHAVSVYLGLRFAAVMLGFVYGTLGGAAIELSGTLSLVLGLTCAAMGWSLPSFILSSKIARRQKEIQRALPDALDLLVICVEAGLGLNQALVRVAVEMRHVSQLMTEEITRANLQIRAGTPREQALLTMADRTGVAAVRSLVTMLIQTERFGTSIAHSLRIHAESLRTKRRQAAEEAAAKTTLKMIFPLATCIFPALFVVILGPALIQIAQSFAQLG